MKVRKFSRLFFTSLLAAGTCAALAASTTLARADEAPAPPTPPADSAAAGATAAADAPAPPAAEPERITGKIYKVDTEDKTITVLVAPERGASGRAYRKYKLMMDDKSLILINQQPSTLAGLESGQIVEVGYFKKNKKEVIDTVVVTGKDDE
jgi:hypothetical protein